MGATWESARAAREHDVGVELLVHVGGTVGDAVEGGFVDAAERGSFLAEEGGLEKRLAQKTEMYHEWDTTCMMFQHLYIAKPGHRAS
jgi:hypothetical protein